MTVISSVVRSVSALIFSMLLLGSLNPVYGALQPLDNDKLQAVEGKGAVTVNWLLAINQIVDPANNDNYVFDPSACDNIKFCRLGLSFNNRYHDGSYVDRNNVYYTSSGAVTSATAFTGFKQWIVFKGIQGTVRAQADLSGTDIVYKDQTNTEQIKAGLQMSFNAASPIKIRNFGFDAVSIETDSAKEGDSSNVPGYLSMNTNNATGIYKLTNGRYDYTNTGLAGYTTSSFDHGRESGFTGLVMHGNLAVQGTIKIFSCDSNMLRC